MEDIYNISSKNKVIVVCILTSSLVSSRSEEVFTGESITQLQEQIKSLMEGKSEPFWKYPSFTEESQWKIYVQIPTRMITIRCNETDLIIDIKGIIEQKEGVPVLNQQLVKQEIHSFPNKPTQIVNIELDDNVSLADYNIQNCQELMLVLVDPAVHKTAIPGEDSAMIISELATINVKSLAGHEYSLKVDLNAPISEVKTILSKQVGFKIEEQRLIFDGKELQNGQILHQCNVKDDSTLHLVTEESQWEISVRTLTGKIITVQCNKTDLIADIKGTIEQKEAIPIVNQQLVKRETQSNPKNLIQIVDIQLDDNASLADYNIQNHQELILMQVDPAKLIPELTTIYVQSSAGEKYPIKIDLNAPISEVKAILSKQVGFEQGEQRLLFDGKELKNNQILCQCNVRDGSTLHLKTVNFCDRVVYIRMLNGRSFPLEYNTSNTIGMIKAMIHDEMSIDVDKQHLVFAAQRLDDGKTLSDYDIKQGDVIHLAVKQGGSLPLSQIGEGKIFIKAPFHASMRVDVHKNDTIATVWTKVQRILADPTADEQAEFPEFIPHEQELMFAGKRLNNKQVLGELGIKDGDTLNLRFTLSLEEIVIKTFSGNSFTVQVTPNDTVETVKTKICERQGISPESQKIIYTGRELENHMQLGELNVHTAATFYLEELQPPKIYVKPLMGEAIALDFDPNVTVAEVKSEIQEKVGISSNQISLLFGGKELEDGQMLAYYGIQDKSTIYMYSIVGVEPILFVKVPSLQKTVLLDYDPEATIRSIKIKLSEKEQNIQISFDQQTLLFEGIHLEDNQTLGSYDIPQEGTIDLIMTKTKNTIGMDDQEYADCIEEYN